MATAYYITDYSKLAQTNGYYTPKLDNLTNNYWSITDHSGTIGSSDYIKDLQHFLNIVPNQKDLIKMPNYPHADCWINEKYEMVMHFAMAGYAKEDVSVEVSKTNQLFIKAKGQEIPKDRAYLHNKISRKDIDIVLQLDTVYDLEKSKTKFTDGMLEIVIPRTPEAKLKKLM